MDEQQPATEQQNVNVDPLVRYTVGQIKAAFLKYYHSPRTYWPEKELTDTEDEDEEFSDFLKFLTS